MPVKIAEVNSTVFMDVNKTEPLWLYLNKAIDQLRYLGLLGSAVEFTELKLSEDLKKGDILKITFENKTIICCIINDIFITG